MSWDIQPLALSPCPVRLGRLPSSGGVQRGTVLFVPGRGDSLELRAPMAMALSALGYAVVLAEHHGQGGSGHLGRHPDAVHIDDFDLHMATQRAALERIEGPVRLMGHSMGGLVGMELLAQRPDRFQSAVFTSPMWRFQGSLPTALVRLLAQGAGVLGSARDFAPGEEPFSLGGCLRMRRGSEEPHEALLQFVTTHGPLLRGGSTWGWVAAAAAAMQRLWRRRFESLDVDVLVVSCLRDQTIGVSALGELTQRLPKGRQLELDCGHDPFFSPEPAHTRLWEHLRSHLMGAA
jgi:lysophospholipase